MSRSGYSDDLDQWDLIRWRGAVASAIRGKRGQAFLQEMLVALDAIADGRLIDADLEKNGEVCALGSVARRRGIEVKHLDPYDHRQLASTFDIAQALACEIMFENDEWHGETPEHRWLRMRAWIVKQIRNEASP